MAGNIPEFDAYLSYFDHMSTDDLLAFLSSSVPVAGLSAQSLAFLQSFGNRILHERQARENAEQQYTNAQQDFQQQYNNVQARAQHMEQMADWFQSELQNQQAAANAAGQAAMGQQPYAAQQTNPQMHTQGNQQPMFSQNQMYQNATVGGASGLAQALSKSLKPPSFDGRNVLDWIFRINQYFTAVDANASDNDKIAFASNLFTGKALTWWRYHTTCGHGFITFKALTDELQLHFIDTDHVNKLRDRLDALTQNKSNVQTYISRFKELQIELGPHALTDAQALHKFVKGLNTQLRVFTNMSRPRDFEEACLAATTVEQSLNGSMGANNNNRAQRDDRMDLGMFTQSNRSQNNRPKQSQQPSSSSTTHTRQKKGKQPASNDAWKKDAVCHHCGKKGHIKPECRALQRQRDGASTSKAPPRQSQAYLAEQVAQLTAELAALKAQKPSKN